MEAEHGNSYLLGSDSKRPIAILRIDSITPSTSSSLPSFNSSHPSLFSPISSPLTSPFSPLSSAKLSHYLSGGENGDATPFFSSNPSSIPILFILASKRKARSRFQAATDTWTDSGYRFSYSLAFISLSPLLLLSPPPQFSSAKFPSLRCPAFAARNSHSAPPGFLHSRSIVSGASRFFCRVR